ncbi:PTS HPr component phosphorylation site [Alkalithermobacter thermoalcaliphilus JW-YL-7 = DSM 7308]|uniref:PTS HPr component phosphorylation site n=1 Tax=Alkalithermobacter thermoalcaliphilus JW-YL-7 = DSM 7308 TaxID=1121328 RepID=A0A150FPH9_CLOPD|nr:phosphoryl transfer system HPr [[Clostridium] paradoxum JW-YL-7 = DSM 7308]SHK89678.1 PTS HPr component phosphorylation site [[Clostridium] paradoxum JW-YL-7 = DSM 7308]
MKVTFIKVEDINRFVEFVSKLKGKVYLKSGEYSVNAKSIIGAMYIVNENPNDIVVEVENEEEAKLVLNFLMQGSHLVSDK